MTILKPSSVLLIGGLLTACGGDIGHDTPTPGSGFSSSSSSSPGASSSSSSTPVADATVRTGRFLDSAVANLGYSTPTQEGVTSADGAFNYLVGESIVFSIGDLQLPEVPGQAVVTPLDIAGTSNVNDPVVVNVARLLQSLDADGDPSNGIVIDELAAGSATAGIDFTQSPEDFAGSSAVTNLVANSGSSNTTLVDASAAVAHLQATLSNSVNERTVLSADGPGGTFDLINNTLGGDAVESPVCPEEPNEADRRITEVMDDTLAEPVFAFRIDTDVDGDRCIEDITDRQRIEIKTYAESPAQHLASEGEIHTYRWKFKLNEGFQPSSRFTHVFQIKARGGEGADDGSPIITFTPRAASTDRLEVLHVANGTSSADRVASADLSEFTGEWVEAYVRTLNAEEGRIEVDLRRLSDGERLISWSSNNIDMWREGADFNRPKWGIYRSIEEIASLRDETVWFNDFCIAEGTNVCPSYFDSYEPGSGSDNLPVYSFEDDALGEAPAGFTTSDAGPVVVSDEQASDGSQSVKLSKVEGENSRLRYELGATPTGTVKASIYVPTDIDVDTYITLYADDTNSSFRAIDVLLKDDGEIRYRDGATGQTAIGTYQPGGWVDVEINWEDLSSTNVFTLTVNGQTYGPLNVDVQNLVPQHLEIKFGASGDATATSIYVDEVSAGESSGAPDSGDDGTGGDGSGETPAADFTFEEAIPAEFDARGPIELSSDQAHDGTQSAKLSKTAGENTQLRHQFGAMPTGSVTAWVYVPTEADIDTYITIYADDTNSDFRAIDVLLKDGSELRYRDSEGQVTIEGGGYQRDAWNKVEIAWEDLASTNVFTLTVNGETYESLPVATSGLVPQYLEVKFGASGDASATSIYVDSVSVSGN